MERPFAELLERPGVNLSSFVWCDNQHFRAVILAVAKDKRGRRVDAAVELSGLTAAQLAAAADDIGCDLGAVAEVEKNCRSAACTPRHMAKAKGETR
jgi:hypothetical protein